MLLRDFFSLVSGDFSGALGGKSLPTFYIEYLALHQYLGEVSNTKILYYLLSADVTFLY